MTSTSPLTVSPVAGTRTSLEPYPSLFPAQVKLLLPAVNEQLKFTDWPGASVPVNGVASSGGLRLLAAVNVAQLLVPVALTLVRVSSPELLSLTTMLTVSPA